MTAKTIEELKARIAELEAENETLRQGEASEERWSEHYATRADELEAENARLKAAQGCEYCGAIGDAPHGEYCRTWKGGDA